MKDPKIEVIFEKVIKLLLQSMEATDNDMTSKAEENIAHAIIILNQIAGISDFGSYELNEQLKYCRNFFLLK